MQMHNTNAWKIRACNLICLSGKPLYETALRCLIWNLWALPPSLLLLYDHKLLASTFKEGGGGGEGGGGNGLIFRTRREEEHLQKIGRGRILAPSFNLVWQANLNPPSIFFHKYKTFWECFESRILPLQHPSTPAAEELGWLR